MAASSYLPLFSSDNHKTHIICAFVGAPSDHIRHHRIFHGFGNAVGMFLEESEGKDYQGLVAFIALSYIVVPFQAYAAIKGFLKGEGPWFRTPKTGRITDVLRRGTFYRFISGILPRLQPDIRQVVSGGHAGRAAPIMRMSSNSLPLVANSYLSPKIMFAISKSICLASLSSSSSSICDIATLSVK